MKIYLSLVLLLLINSSLWLTVFFTDQKKKIHPIKSLKKEIRQKRLASKFEKILEDKRSLTKVQKSEMRNSIFQAEQKFGISNILISELIFRESSFNPRAISPVGARGLTQLMPRTAKYICNLDLEQIYQIRKNILCGSKYLSRLLRQFDGDLELALASYNMGPTIVRRISQKKNYKSVKHLINPTTRRYVASISSSVQGYS